MMHQSNINAEKSLYLVTEGLEKSFGVLQVLRDVSIAVKRGEFVSFLGPSGCGKTTLLRMIAGLETQSAGRIIQDGRDISQMPPQQRDFGIVFQSYALFPNLKVTENVGFGLVGSKMPKQQIARRCAELIELVGISEHANKYPAQLSGGQQQRVAIARALAMSPGLLLLDEPLSALDARVRLRLREELRDLQHKVGVTTIMVTHDQDEALSISDRIVVMNAGNIEQFGTPIEIYNKPATQFVAEFVGDITMMSGVVTDSRHVKLGTVDIECPDALDLGIGTPVSVGIRPEDVTLLDPGASSPNAVSGVVRSIQFSGSSLALKVVAPTLTDKPVQLRVSASQVADHGLSEGHQVRIGLSAKALHIFPQERAGT